MLTYLRIVLAARTRNQCGASAVEYAMLVAMVGIMIGVIVGTGDILTTLFSHENSKIGECYGCSVTP